jgi:phage-related minor tail protein
MANLIVDVTTKIDDKQLKAAGKKMSKFLGTGLKAGGAVAGAALGAVGAAMAVATSETVNFAEESDKAMEQFRRQTGLSEKGVETFEKSAKDLFALGVGEGIDDIAESMAEVQNIMQSGAKETEGMTKRALAMRDVFDKDVGESVDTVKVLMDEFGLTSDQAFDLMATGMQKGLDRNGDFLDSIREYGNIFGDAGFTADQFFSVMETGAEGGVLGTDKISDAVKEFGVKIVDAKDDTVQAFSDIGLNFNEVSEGISSGSISIADTFDEVAKRSAEIEDPIKRARIQSAIFGTMAEDLGVSFTEGLTTASSSLEDMTGAMDEVVAKNQTIGESMETLKRQLVVALEPAARELMPLFAEGVAKVSEFFTAARPIFQDFASDLRNSLGPAMAIIGDSLARISEVLGITSEGASGLDAALAILEGTLGIVVTAIEAVAIASKFLADAFEIAKNLGQQIAQIGSALGETIGLGGGSSGGGFGSILGFQGGGIVPGSPGQAVPIIAHGGEEIANPNTGQAIVIDGETFAVRAAGEMANAINGAMQRNAQLIIDTVAENI